MTIDVFTSGRDYRPHTPFANKLPPNALYARVLVAADDFDAAEDALRKVGLGRYVETLRGPNAPDGPAEAINAYVADSGITEPTIFVVYRIDADAIGQALNPPRLLVARIVGADLTVIGRVRVVSKASPPASYPIHRVVPDDDQPDPVPLAGTPDEGPTDDVPLVEGPIDYPVGALGYMTKSAERRLVPELDDVRSEIEMLINSIERARRSPDPQVSWGRQSGRLLDLSRRLSSAAADAATVETVLQAGI